MDINFAKVKNYLLDLEYSIVSEDESTGIFKITKEEEGIVNMIVVCADPIVILEQPLFKIKNESLSIYKQLLPRRICNQRKKRSYLPRHLADRKSRPQRN